MSWLKKRISGAVEKLSASMGSGSGHGSSSAAAHSEEAQLRTAHLAPAAYSYTARPPGPAGAAGGPTPAAADGSRPL